MEFWAFAIFAAIVVIAVIAIDYICEWIHERFDERRMVRIAVLVEDEFPRLYDKAMDMSIETIKNINQRLFDSITKEEEP